jgi:anti-anti-sigma regulatory factor
MPVVATAPTETVSLETSPELDIVIDFHGMQTLDLAGLTMLLTAQQIADSENRQVWLMDLPEGAWRLLKALGLDDLFEFAPIPGDDPN